MSKKKMTGDVDVASSIAKKQLCEMVSSYKAYRGIDSESDESHYAWFSMRALQDFFSANGMELSYKSGDTVNMSGLRLYFGRHLHTDKYYADRVTAILVPTQKVQDGEHNDYYDATKKMVALYPGMTDPKPSLVYDYATLCPPNCMHSKSDVAETVYVNDESC